MGIYKTEEEIKEGLFGASSTSDIPVKTTPVSPTTTKPVVEINYVSTPIASTPIVQVEPVVEVVNTPTPIQEEKVVQSPVTEASQPVSPIPASPVASEPAVTPTPVEQHLADEVKEKVDDALKIVTEEEKAKMAEEEAKKIAEIDKHSLEYLRINDIDVDSGINILGDEETYKSMLKEFHRTSKDIFGKLIEYKATKDTVKYAEQSYSLKNNANYFGFVKLCEYAKDHELKAKDNDFNYISEHFKEYDDELMRIVNVLNEFFG